MVRTAKTVHDQKLELWGDRTEAHSTNPLPYSSSLGKKKKIQKADHKRERDIQARGEGRCE